MVPHLAVITLIVFGCGALHASDVGILEHLLVMRDIPPDADTLLNQPVSVCRMDLDVTGDGKPELFIGTTWEAGLRGMPWVVYSSQSDGRYRPLGLAVFRYEEFYYSQRHSTIFVPVPADHHQPGYVYYHIGADGVWEIEDGSLIPTSPREDVARMRAWQTKGRPAVFCALLQDLRAGAAPTWSNADTGKIAASLGRLNDPVAESPDCSAERILKEYRGAGCLPAKKR